MMRILNHNKKAVEISFETIIILIITVAFIIIFSLAIKFVIKINVPESVVVEYPFLNSNHTESFFKTGQQHLAVVKHKIFDPNNEFQLLQNPSLVYPLFLCKNILPPTKIYVDIGHGGKDFGYVSSVNYEYDYLKEIHLALSTLSNIEFTYPPNQVDVPDISQRLSKLDQNSVLISIHALGPNLNSNEVMIINDYQNPISENLACYLANSLQKNGYYVTFKKDSKNHFDLYSEYAHYKILKNDLKGSIVIEFGLFDSSSFKDELNEKIIPSIKQGIEEFSTQ